MTEHKLLKLNIYPTQLSSYAIKLFPLVVLILLWALLTWRWLSGEVLIPYDSKTYHLPMSAIALDFLRADSPPVWNSFSFSGTPLLSDPQLLLFSPVYMALMAVGDYYSSNWIDVVQLIHVLLAGIGGYFYSRTREIPPVAAIIVALIIMFGGAMSARMQHTAIIVAFAYFPWALLAVDQMLIKRQVRWIIIAALLTFLLAVHFVQLAFLLCLFIACYVVMEIAATNDRALLLNKLKWSFITGSITVLLLSIPAALVLYNLSLSTRPHIPFELIHNAIHPTTLLTLIAPDALGSLVKGQYKGNGDITEQYLYFGIITVSLLLNATIYAIRQKDRELYFWISVASLMLAYALGKGTPIYKFYYDFIPGVSLFRRPTDAVFVFGFAVAMVAGIFLSKTTSYCNAVKSNLFFGISIVVPQILVAFVGVYGLTHVNWVTYIKPHTLYLFLLFLAITVGIPFLARLQPKFFCSTSFSIMLLLGIAIDFVSHNIDKPMNASNWSGYSLLKRAQKGEIPALNWLRSATAPRTENNMPVRVEISGLPQNWDNTVAAFGLESTGGYNPLRLDIYQRVVGNRGKNHARPLLSGYDSPMFNLLGIRFIMFKKGTLSFDDHRFPLRYESKTDGLSIEIRENPRSLPRVFSVTEAIFEPDVDLAIRDGISYNVDFYRQVILEKNPFKAIVLKARESTSLCDDSTGTTRMISYAPNRLVIESSSQCRRILVVNNVWHPGWQAFVDSTESELLKTNFLFQGILLEPGHQTVELIFNPFNF